MTYREQYAPGAASGAQIRKDGEKWTLILVRELRHQAFDLSLDSHHLWRSDTRLHL